MGSILVVLATLGLAAGLVVALMGGLSQRVTLDRGLRLTALDAVAAEGARSVQVAAVLADRRTGRPVPSGRAVVRFADGWVGAAAFGPRGIAWYTRPGGLPVGEHPYEVAMSEEQPLLDVRACATVWVRSAETPVVWVDAAAILPPGSGGPIAPDAAETLRALADRHALVYLVAGDLDRYEAVRRGAAGVASGPAVWIAPGTAARTLKGLQAAWPKVAAALVADADLRQAAAGRQVPVLSVPRAGDASAEAAGPWREVRLRLLGNVRAPGAQNEKSEPQD
jgi:hypothetical protein